MFASTKVTRSVYLSIFEINCIFTTIKILEICIIMIDEKINDLINSNPTPLVSYYRRERHACVLPILTTNKPKPNASFDDYKWFSETVKNGIELSSTSSAKSTS